MTAARFALGAICLSSSSHLPLGVQMTELTSTAPPFFM
jgi:hypothetical protein